MVGDVIGIVAVFYFQNGILIRSGIIMKMKMKTVAISFSFFLPMSFALSIPNRYTYTYRCTHMHTYTHRCIHTCTYTGAHTDMHTHTHLNISFPHYRTFPNVSIQRHLLNKDTQIQLKKTIWELSNLRQAY